MKRGPNRRRRSRPFGDRGKKRSKSRSSVKPTSSFTALKPSSASVALLATPKRPRPICFWHLLALLTLLPLIFFSVGTIVLVPALALLLPGFALLVRPPSVGPGRLLGWAVIGFLAVLAAAFVPQFYWLEAEWRAVAVDFHDIDLPGLLSVQPIVSLEAWLHVVAGFAWFYAAYSWPLNDNGRRWFFIVLSVLASCFAGFVLWGNQSGVYFPGTEATGVFSFFPEWNQTAAFLAMAGVVCFTFAVKEFQSRTLASVGGFLAAALCLSAVTIGVPRLGFWLFIAGLAIWYVKLLLGRSTFSRTVTFGFPLVLVLLSIFCFQGELEQGRPLLVFGEALRMWGDSPLAGVGLGNFSAILPQYQDAAVEAGRAVRPFNELIRLLTESGIFGLTALGLLVLAYGLALRGPAPVHGRSLRLAAFFGVAVFGMHALVASPLTEPGLTYFAILLAALALPPVSTTDAPTLRPGLWRVLGLVLTLAAGLWLLASVDRIPFYSKVALTEFADKVKKADESNDSGSGLRAVEEWLDWAPLDWRAHQWQARFILRQNGAQSEAAAAFDRARFVQPKLGQVALDEGFYWLPHSGPKTIEAWEEALRRDLPDPVGAFSAMVSATRGRPALAPGLSRLSRMDQRFRLVYLEALAGDALMQEILQELGQSAVLSQFDQAQRTRLLKRWITDGDLLAAEDFLDRYPDSVDRAWWLRALAESKKANFARAVTIFREHVAMPEFPPAKEGEEATPVLRLKREFWVNSEDFIKGASLLQILFEEGAYGEALAVCDAMLEGRSPRPVLQYWRGECLYQLGDFIESWFAFEKYVERGE